MKTWCAAKSGAVPSLNISISVEHTAITSSFFMFITAAADARSALCRESTGRFRASIAVRKVSERVPSRYAAVHAQKKKQKHTRKDCGRRKRRIGSLSHAQASKESRVVYRLSHSAIDGGVNHVRKKILG